MNYPDENTYMLISPCRNEAGYMRRTIDSVVAQSLTPVVWVIVDDGSTDETPEILAEYAARHDWIRVVSKPDRGHRAVGPGVIEAFYVGLDAIGPKRAPYLCKLDLDLDLPPRYFEILVDRMTAEPRLGTCSGKPYVRRNGRLVSERRGDEMSVGMTKFYRTRCFEDIGGFVREVMWDAIDCHKARQKGWIAESWDEPDLRFEHLRPMGSSQTSIMTGRARHGFGQWFMGSDPFYYMATCMFRMAEPPYVLGGLAMAKGYLGAWWRGVPQFQDKDFRTFIRAWQRRALIVGKVKATAEVEAAQADQWSGPV
ncbi:glycosyltransferase family 2 protein [Jannaschia sp. CCS1]|uniref:glycosyltransferase family 2 protein n=1 Tax=Jannaschia sp. (strain CCS1) TaxID=290400 RepID=UPI000053A3CA|nr:glycosyltransferase family A protein [Jannaschia sp. CCS1]ABD57189.1 glycosyl transferase family 2 [Jannaschia sp. CCS1]